jgi:hypothetical protein
MFNSNDKVNLHLVSRDRTRSIVIPGIVTGEVELTTFERRGSRVATSVVEVLSLRQRVDQATGEVLGTYLRRSVEQVPFVSRRLDGITVPGLDDLSLAALEDRLSADISEFQLRQAQARQPVGATA